VKKQAILVDKHKPDPKVKHRELKESEKMQREAFEKLERSRVASLNMLIDLRDEIMLRKDREIEIERAREQLEQLNIYLQRIREEERIRISRELHDDLGQSLTAIKIDLGNLKLNIHNKERIESGIENLLLLVTSSIDTVQRLTSELRPHVLDDLGLGAAIEWYTSEYIKRTGIKIKLKLESNIDLPVEIELVIFRILQESLTNIARHSKADNVEIYLFRQKSNILLEVIDNGIGISDSEKKSRNSLGLLNMSERAKEIGGTLVIDSSKNQGARICLTVPDLLFEE
jgi:signal transduction histidine kinase